MRAWNISKPHTTPSPLLQIAAFLATAAVAACLFWRWFRLDSSSRVIVWRLYGRFTVMIFFGCIFGAVSCTIPLDSRRVHVRAFICARGVTTASRRGCTHAELEHLLQSASSGRSFPAGSDFHSSSCGQVMMLMLVAGCSSSSSCCCCCLLMMVDYLSQHLN